MAVYDRWHRAKPLPGKDGRPITCEHKAGGAALHPSAEHGKGDRWQVRWRDDEGKQQSRNFGKNKGRDPELHAEAFDAARTADMNRGNWIDPRRGQTPFEVYAATWLNSRLHRPSTVETYESHLRLHILPTFKTRGLARIEASHVQAWIRALAAKGLAARTIETIYVIFSSILRGAVRDGYLVRSPCVDVRLPAAKATTVRILTPAQVYLLASRLPRRYRLLAYLGAGCGLRQGEALGLTLDRVAGGEISVDRQVVVTDRKPVLAEPKTPASIRSVPLPRFVAAAIERHVHWFGAEGGGVLCRTGRGALLRRDYFNARVWRPALIAARLPLDATFHDLRHTFASTALSEGVPVLDVSRWLGHKSITTTVDLYGHLVPHAGDRARTALDGAFGFRAHVP